MGVSQQIGAMNDKNVVTFLAKNGILRAPSYEIEQKINKLTTDAL